MLTGSRRAPRDGAVVDRHVPEERVGQGLELSDAEIGAEDLIEQACARPGAREPDDGAEGAPGDARREGHGREMLTHGVDSPAPR